jgi:hypothetical protein
VSCTGLTGVGAVLWKFPGFTSRTGLTGGAHRPDRCKLVRLKVCVPVRSRVREVGCCPRTSSTPVAMWSWKIWVVSRRRVLEAVFILSEPLSPLRRIFISSHSLPLSGSPFRSFKWYKSRLQVLIDSNQSKIQGWHTRNRVRVLRTSMEKTTRCGVSGWRRSSAEDHVWFEDRWMVASLCDE